MLRLRLVFAVLACVTAPFATMATEPSFDQEISALAPILESYPPQFASQQDHDATVARYKRLMSRLDQAVTKHPKDWEVLYRRAAVETFGHNLDMDGAFAAAERDFLTLIDHVPSERIILDLGNLWVNSNPMNAPRAEKAFLAAQCLHGTVPPEEAQRGLFFAYYYQGRMQDAKERTAFLRAHWPDEKVYQEMDDNTAEVLKRNNEEVKVGEAPKMLTCEKAG